MRLNLANCAFGVQAGKFLGYMVTERGIEVDLVKVKAIIDMNPSPQDAEGSPGLGQKDCGFE